MVGNAYAAAWLRNRLVSLGLDTYTQDFENNGQNIYAVQPGKELPNQQVIICAHYDNMPFSNIAAGADDNASGTIAVLEAARILSKFKTKYTIIYAFFDHEEQGLFGSKYYAHQAYLRKDSIVAVINLDMIGYDGNNDSKAGLHVRNSGNSIDLGETIKTVNKNYNTGLNLILENPGSAASDHASFWAYFITAVMLIEDLFTDKNPWYHTSADIMEKMNIPYYLKCTKLAIGSLAKVAGVLSETHIAADIPKKFELYQNYPNPFNPTTTIKYSLDESMQVKLVVYDQLSQEIAVLVNAAQNSGYHEIPFKTEDLNISSGIYFYALYAGNSFSVKKMVVAK
jgi:Zn-dependent M28 family amino/carboxypeptidase